MRGVLLGEKKENTRTSTRCTRALRCLNIVKKLTNIL